MSDKAITPEVRNVLSRAAITDTQLVIIEQLSPKLYREVNVIIERAGGKWHKGKKAHLFAEGNALMKLASILSAGVAIDEKKKLQAFFTPDDLAARVVETASVEGHIVLEPSAGEGALADACMDAGAKGVRCIEINGDHVKRLHKKGYAGVLHCDFLSLIKPTEKFSRIVMNPPFTKGQDMKHVMAATKWLSNNAKLVSIICGSMATRPNFEQALGGWGLRWEATPLGSGAFKESGTMVNTSILEVWT